MSGSGGKIRLQEHFSTTTHPTTWPAYGWTSQSGAMLIAESRQWPGRRGSRASRRAINVSPLWSAALTRSSVRSTTTSDTLLVAT
ncbi:hypothetical protein E2C01_019654 [Portunus trituberculatus]|uniref:Uncharacterized protein n=1 Tax=Portunus trituberculatus TaxID=210409 RepID=A0A5B7DXU4_PORTR|nr:hypothetical protein [Portunus trituberculatus]